MAKQWDSHEVSQVVDRIYQQVLERKILAADGSSTDSGLLYYSEKLSHGQMSVREVVREVALSKEYKDRFIIPNVDQDVVKALYKHLLARDADAGGMQYWTSIGESDKGWPAVIQNMVEGEEYSRRFGDDNVPG